MSDQEDPTCHHRQIEMAEMTKINGQIVVICFTLRPYLPFFLLLECHPISRLFLVYKQYPFRDFTLIVWSFVTLCIHHPSSSPVIAHFNQQSIPQYSYHIATTACTCILPVLFYSSLYHLPHHRADQSDTSVPVAIYFLGPFRLPKHLFKYIISGILLHLYIFSFHFLSAVYPSPRCYHQLSSHTTRFQSLTGIAPTISSHVCLYINNRTCICQLPRERVNFDQSPVSTVPT
jgi:hypothetical protein